MPRSIALKRKRNKSTKSQILRRRREKAMRECLSNDWVSEDTHVDFFSCLQEDELPPIEVETSKKSSEILAIDGNRIINLNHLIEETRKLTYHDIKCTMGKMRLLDELRYGLVSKLKYYCNTCDTTLYITTHPLNQKEIPTEAFVWGSLSIGIGFSQSQEFLAILNIPQMTKKTFRKHEENIGVKWETELHKYMQRAAKEEKQLAIKKWNVEHGIPYITVIVDGGWAKRSYEHSYSSMSGVACIIGEETKKLLFIGVRNKFCYACTIKSTKSHKCCLNYSGPPTSMEQDIIVEGFNRSEKDYGLRYKFVIGDGDSSVYAKIIQHVSYGRFVQKLECANHITRAFTSNLHKIALKTSFGVETRRLLKLRIKRLTIDVRTAIARSTNIDLLRTDLKNLPSHVFGNHAVCRDEICRRKFADEENLVDILKQSNMYQEIEKAVDNVIRKADRLKRNVTTNHAERYMSLLAKFSGGKRVNFSTGGSFQRRCLGAALSYNAGPSWHANLLKNKQIVSLCTMKDKLRIYKQKIRSSRLKGKISTVCNIAHSDTDYGPKSLQATADLPQNELNVVMKNKVEELEVDKNNVIKIERDTVGQNANLLWYEARRNRLTASHFGSICSYLRVVIIIILTTLVSSHHFQLLLYMAWAKEGVLYRDLFYE